MPKTKTSRRRVKFSKDTKNKLPIKPISLKSEEGLTDYEPGKILQDKNIMIMAIVESIEENDHEALIEILKASLIDVNKTEFAKKAGISRSTLYDILNGRKNPSLKFFIRCVHELWGQ